MATEDQIDKVRKLLAKAQQAGTPEEAAAFFAGAAKLMTKYQVDEHMVNARQKKDQLRFTRMPLGKKIAADGPSHHTVRQVIRHCFHVEILKVGTKSTGGLHYLMIGEECDMAFVAYAWPVLNATWMKLWHAYRARTGTPQLTHYMRSFFFGLRDGFMTAWDEAQAAQLASTGNQSFALVLVDKDTALTAFVDEDKTVRRPKTKDLEVDAFAYMTGVKEGKEIKVNQPLPAR